jgi:PKD repeat protein
MLARYQALPAPHPRRSLALAGAIACGWLQCGEHAAPVTLRWDYTASGAAGFMLHCGTASRNYATRVDVGNTDTYTIGTLPEGGTSYCAVTAYDPAKAQSGYSNEVAIYVPASTALAASFSATPLTGRAPLSVAFTDQSTGGPVAWAWDFGDGTSSSARNPSKTYNKRGSYTVLLRVTGADGKVSQSAATTIAVKRRLR